MRICSIVCVSHSYPRAQWVERVIFSNAIKRTRTLNLNSVRKRFIIKANNEGGRIWSFYIHNRENGWSYRYCGVRGSKSTLTHRSWISWKRWTRPIWSCAKGLSVISNLSNIKYSVRVQSSGVRDVCNNRISSQTIHKNKIDFIVH